MLPAVHLRAASAQPLARVREGRWGGVYLIAVK
jgi:hypothetical protein